MNNSLTDVASLKHEIISWLDDMFPTRIPESPRTENPEIVVVSNRIMTIPKLACSNIYMFLASRMMTDELRGLDLVVCRGSAELTRTLLSIVQVNEHGLTKGVASLLANYAAQTQHQEDTWVITIEQDTPRPWLHGWFRLSKVLKETQRQLKFLADAERQTSSRGNTERRELGQ